MKKILLLLAAGLMVCAYIIGCSTEDPWQPEPSRALELSMVSGPADTVAYGSTVSFSWTSSGGSGEVTYQYRLDSGTWSTASNVTSVTYSDVTAGATFGVMATDAASATDEVSRTFAVGAESSDADVPTVSITSSPTEGSFVATGSNVSFTWGGDDEVDGSNLSYWYSFAGATSDTGTTTTAVFMSVTAGAATFSVWALDQSGNASAAATVSFTIKDASILYVDDFQWFDAAGNVDMPKERNQKQFYRDALEGYAFAEWDIAVQGMPDSTDLVVGSVPVYSTIVFASDSDIGSTDATWWYEVGGVAGGGVLDHYLENGGKLLATGPLVLLDMTQAYPPEPEPGHFEYDWFGIDSTSWCWDYWYWLSWVIKDTTTTLPLPDSMKIDVAKNGDQDDYAIETPGLRNDGTVTTEIIFTWGLWLDGSEPTPLGNPVGHIVSFSGTPQTAMLNFDTYAMPLPGIRQTFQTILTEFGE
ncbi:MAG: hypothetical protein V3W18_04330 [candidate division Zixibacteria bacterium]